MKYQRKKETKHIKPDTFRVQSGNWIFPLLSDDSTHHKMEEKMESKTREMSCYFDRLREKPTVAVYLKKYSNPWMRSSALETVKEGRMDKNRRSLLAQ